MSSELEALIERLPKAELHVHIEGTLEPELMFRLAQKNQVKLPYATTTELKGAYQFNSLQGFLDLYYQGTSVLKKQSDFFYLAHTYFAKAHENNIRHVEISFDPQAHTERGVHFGVVIEGLLEAIESARSEFNITTKLILSFLRHLPEDSAFKTLESALGYRNYITAVGLDSSEKDNPPKKFQNVFAKARSEGFLTVAHAGEEGPADYIKQALDILRARRIDHGVRCVEDASLVARLAKEQIPLTVCPLSNVKTKVFSKITDHNIKTLINQGLLVTVNSDDPAYFGGYLNENYNVLVNQLGFTQEDIIQLCKNSFTASFLDKDSKEEYVKLVDASVELPKVEENASPLGWS